LHMSYDAPDVYPHGARIEKTARFADERRLVVEYRVALSLPDPQRLAEEAAGKIFAAPPPEPPVPQSFQVLSSVPAEREEARGSQFCWPTVAGNNAEKNAGAAFDRCEAFVAGGPSIALPAEATRLQIRQPRRPALALDWSGAPEGTRLALEPQLHTMLLRLSLPPLDPGGAAAAFRIEFSVPESP
ncbi:MAG TPA: hypothetical protein VKG84_04750, partial [Candidatus Acidoferrales bacterium]|nr:hypothetical protein [Candidatus Acidoferrales bacterium]